MKGKELNLLLEEKLPDIEYRPVFFQPKLGKIKISKSSLEHLVKWALICYRRQDKDEFGRVYNELLKEYKPLLDWAFLSWDYLLTTQGIRYLPRKGIEKYNSHGDYRPFTQKDYRRMLHKVFKEILLTYSPNGNFNSYLREKFWAKVLSEYELLKIPQGKNERLLTEYSYLRCIPYRFFNRYHEEKVNNSLRMLNKLEQMAIELYFLKFYTDEACAEESNLRIEKFLQIKDSALNKIKYHDYLSYALLKQIERY